MARVMLSAVGGPVAVSIIQHLRKLGHQVVGHDGRADAVGLDFVDKFWRSPPAIDANAYLDFLDQIGPECDIYLPFLDEELRLMATHEERISRLRCTIVRSPAKTLAIFTSKIDQQKALELAGHPIAPRASCAPAVFKPDFGRGGGGVVRADEADLFELMMKRPGFLAQQAIDGVEYTVDALVDNDGHFLFAVARQRLVAKGVSIIGRIDMSPDVLTLTRRVVQSHAFAGPINLQMIREASGALHIIEVNARLSGSLMFTVMAGFDILDATIGLYEGRRFEPPTVEDGLLVRRYWQEL
jgi:carbamoyl-phosphate synthase large subunit